MIAHAPRPPSRTSVLVGMLRAAHLHMDPAPHVFADTFALGLCGLETVEKLEVVMRSFRLRFGEEIGAEAALHLELMFRAGMVWRARQSEDRIVAGFARGVDQCVILGAGLDSTAYRLGARHPGVRFFEVDHPGSQAWKRERLDAMNVPPPANLTYASVDFERDALLPALMAAGLRLDRPAVVTWLGVSMYLDRRTMDGVLGTFAEFAPGSDLIMDYATPPETWTPNAVAIMGAVRNLTAESAEPMICFPAPAELAAVACGFGLTVLADVGPAEASERYLEGRQDDLTLDDCPLRVVEFRVPEQGA